MPEQLPAKQTYVKVVFLQNNVEHVYVNWTGSVSGATNVPKMEVSVPDNVGTLDEKPLELRFPRNVDAFIEGFADGTMNAPTSVSVYEVSLSAGPITADAVERFYGKYRVSRAVRHPNREKGVLLIEAVSIKGRLGVPLGIAATPMCGWTFGDKSCQATVTTETGTIAAISGKTLSLTSGVDAAVVAKAGKYWHRGAVTVEALTIGIRNWVSGSYDFELVREPPPSWVTKTVTLRPGCDKTKDTCNDRWSNIANFGGIGIAIPAYHPVTESPS